MKTERQKPGRFRIFDYSFYEEEKKYAGKYLHFISIGILGDGMYGDKFVFISYDIPMEFGFNLNAFANNFFFFHKLLLKY